MKKILICVLTALIIVGLGYLKPQTILGQVMELKAVCFVQKDVPIAAMISTWIERVNAELKGVLKVNWLGGPEIIPPFDQPEALKRNMIQIGFLPAAYYGGILPEGDAICLSNYDFTKEREKGGVFDYFVERHKKINMMVLGTWLLDPFYLRINKAAKGLEDLKGTKMRTAAKYDKMMRKLGMIPITVQFGETYEGLQRGLVEGFGWSTLGPREYGWLEYCRYFIDIPFYKRGNCFILMNLDVWNSLSKDAQNKLMDITIKFEPDMKAYFQKAVEDEIKEWGRMGIKGIKFSPEDTNKFIKTANDSLWEDFEKKVPEEAKILKKLMGY